jgi:hypothetical protein
MDSRRPSEVVSRRKVGHVGLEDEEEEVLLHFVFFRTS